LSTDEAGESFAKLATLTETPIPKIENLGSSINELSNNMATSAGEITENMLQSAGSLSSLGATNTEIAALAGSMNEMYQSASMAGRGLRRVSQEMTSPKKVGDLASALNMTSEEFTNMRDEDPTKLMLRMAEAMKGGGKQAEQLRGTLSSFSRMALTNMGKNLEDTRKALGMSASAFKENTSLQEEFEIATKSLSAQIQQLRNAVTNVGIQTGRVFIPYVKSAVEILTSAVSAFSELNSATNGAAGAVALVSGVVAGLLPVLGLLVQTIGPALPLISGLGSAFVGLAGPIGVVAAAVGGLYVAWKRNLFGVQDATYSAVSSVRASVNGLIAGVRRGVDAFRSGWKGMASYILSEDIGGALDSVREAIRSASAAWNALLAGNGPKFRQHIKAAFSAAKTAAKVGIDGLYQLFDSLAILLTDTWSAIFGPMPEDVQNAFRSAATAVGAGIGAILSKLLGFEDQSSSLWEHAMRTGQVAVERFMPLIRGKLSSGLDAIVSRVRSFGSRMMGIFSAIFPLLPEPVQQALNRVNKLWETHGVAAVSKARTAYQNAVGAVQSVISTLETEISETLSYATGIWETHKSSVMREARLAYRGAVNSVRSALNGVREAIESSLSDALGVWREHTAEVKGEASNAYQGAANAISTKLTQLGTKVRSKLLGVAGKWREHSEEIKTAVTTGIGAAIGLYVGRINGLIALVRSGMTEATELWESHGSKVNTALTKVGTALAPYKSKLAALGVALTSFGVTTGATRSKILKFATAIGGRALTVLRSLGTFVTGSILPVLRGSLIPAIGNTASAFATRLKSGAGIANSAFQKLRGILLSSSKRLRAARGTAVKLATKLRGVLGKAVTVLRGRFASFASLLTGRIPGPIKRIISSAGRLASKLGGPLLSKITSVITRFGSFALRIGSVGSKLSLLTNPIGIVVAAVAGLYLAWKKNILGIRDITRDIFNAVKSILRGDMESARQNVDSGTSRIKEAWGKIRSVIDTAREIFGKVLSVIKDVMTFLWKNAVKPAIDRILEIWNQRGDEIMKSVGQLVDFLKTTFKAVFGTLMFLWQNFGDEIQTIAKGAFEVLGTIIDQALDTIITAFTVFTDLLAGDWTSAFDKIKDYVDRTFGRIGGLVDTFVETFLGVIDGLIESTIGFFEDMYDAIVGNSIIPEMFSAIKDATTEFISKLLEFFGGLVDDATDKATDLKDNVIEKVESLYEDGKDTIDEMKSKIVDKLGDLASDAKTEAEDLKDDVLSAFETLYDDATDEVSDMASDVMDYVTGDKGPLGNIKSAGKSLIGEFVQGIKDKVSDVGDAVDDVAQTARDNLPFSPAKEGPLSDLDETGPAFVAEIAGGILNNTEELADAAQSAASAAKVPMPAVDDFGLSAEEIASANRPRGPAPDGSGGETKNEFNVEVHANSRREGREAAKGFTSGLRSYNFD
jgi:TP901 family phage tail tape measure protein